MSHNKLESLKSVIDGKQVRMIDLKCIDLTGRLHHISLPVKEGILEKLLEEGVGFDGSSYGFRKAENSDMILVPDLSTAVIDPFRDTPTLSFYSNIRLTDGRKTPFSQDGRFLASKAEDLLSEITGCQKVLWGPEFEFYIFSNVEYDTRTSTSFYRVQHQEEFYKNAYHAANPFDLYDDFRDEASKLLGQLGIPVKYHHHEVGERGQQEIETYFCDTLTTADNVITAKYALFNLAREHNLFITFMPKPMYNQAGNGLHLHLFLTKDGKNAFYEKGAYGNIGQLGKYFIGGLLKHGSALAAFTNPSTNSFKRLVPGFEAPVGLTYGTGNRTSAIRIPKYVTNPEETRFEYRPPDATMNPYICLTSMILAGLDGVANKIDPMEQEYGPVEEKLSDFKGNLRFLPRNLSEALDELKKDNEFLRRGGIFTDELLSQWISVKEEEIRSIQTMPHPFEYKMYFNL